MTLENEIALVTGASRGIGLAIANRLARARATVIGTATTEPGAEGIQERLMGEFGRGLGLVMDVSDSQSVQAAMEFLTDHTGAPTILVNNAGITRDNLLMRMKEEEWQAVLNTNLTSVFRLSKACVKGMLKARSGRIINIASVVGSTGNPGQANYAAAKAGAMGFTKSLARELAPRNITVNSVAPGFIDTDMTRGLSDEQRKALLQQIPLGRLGAAEEVAEVVAFLASSAAGYITGETIHVNGGMYMP